MLSRSKYVKVQGRNVLGERDASHWVSRLHFHQDAVIGKKSDVLVRAVQRAVGRIPVGLYLNAVQQSVAVGVRIDGLKSYTSRVIAGQADQSNKGVERRACTVLRFNELALRLIAPPHARENLDGDAHDHSENHEHDQQLDHAEASLVPLAPLPLATAKALNRHHALLHYGRTSACACTAGKNTLGKRGTTMTVIS